MTAILGGLATAVFWATTLVGSARAARLIGPWSTLAWVMLVGLAVALPLVLLTGSGTILSTTNVIQLAAAGIANSVGLLLGYTALRRGKVAVVGPIISTEGAIGAVLAILAGDPVTAAAAALLAIIAAGVVLTSMEQASARVTAEGDPRPNPDESGRSAAVTAALALGAAALFGVNLFLTSRIATSLPVAWSMLPARVAGVIAVSVPLILSGRLRLTRAAAPFVVIVGVFEVVGIAAFAFASRDSAPVASVISSQFAGIAAVFAFLRFGERLGRIQVVGVVVIATGVAALAAVRAS
ncbi:MAG TPA: DMT family transporter [Candidatus Limnocylindrales bacterium]|nr:DMT family transporter [Candidatus Limnocylindrales bacterium]